MSNPAAPVMPRLDAWLPNTTWAAPLAERYPYFAEGLARVGDVICADSALRSAEKMLFAAAIAAVKTDADLLDHFMSQVKAGGITVEVVDGACVGVLISRGARPHALLTAARDKHYPTPPVPAAAAGPAATADVPSAYAYFEQYFSFVPDYVELLGEQSPAGLEGYFLMRQTALSGTAVPSRLMELLLCAVNAAEYQSRFITIHARAARRAGATEQELVEACLVAMPLAGVASWLPAADGIIASRDS